MKCDMLARKGLVEQLVEELFFVEELGENMSCGHSGHCREKWRQVGHKV